MTDHTTEQVAPTSITHVTCVTVTCAGCSSQAPLYDDMGVAHYDSVDHAIRELVTDNDVAPDFQWSVDRDSWFCPICTADRACQAAGGHQWTEWDGYDGGRWEFRGCERVACIATEKRSTPSGQEEVR